MAEIHLTAARVRELLNYNPETGALSWRVTLQQGKIKPGDAAGGKPRKGTRGYSRIAIDGKEYRTHRVAWLHYYGEWPPRDLDHRDRNKANNAIGNLRPADHVTNAQNVERACSHSQTQVQGVWKSGKKYVAAIVVDGKQIHLGRFTSIEQAQAARAKAKQDLHPGFAVP